MIECLKASGLQIKDIKRYIDLFLKGDSTIQERRKMFYDQKKCVEEEIKALQNTLNMLTYKCWFYDMAAEFGNVDAVKNLPEDKIPEKIKKLKTKINNMHVSACQKKTTGKVA